MILAFFTTGNSSIGPSNTGPQQDILTTTYQIAMTFAVDIQGPQSMIPILFKVTLPLLWCQAIPKLEPNQ